MSKTKNPPFLNFNAIKEEHPKVLQCLGQIMREAAMKNTTDKVFGKILRKRGTSTPNSFQKQTKKS